MKLYFRQGTIEFIITYRRGRKKRNNKSTGQQRKKKKADLTICTSAAESDSFKQFLHSVMLHSRISFVNIICKTSALLFMGAPFISRAYLIHGKNRRGLWTRQVVTYPFFVGKRIVFLKFGNIKHWLWAMKEGSCGIRVSRILLRACTQQCKAPLTKHVGIITNIIQYNWNAFGNLGYEEIGKKSDDPAARWTFICVVFMEFRKSPEQM